jgi:hypothetical protein
MRKANRMIVEDFSANQIVNVAEASRTAARLMGTDVSSAYDQISDAVVNLRIRGLKTAGFVIDLADAYAKHAAKIGTTTEQLSDYGKQMALVEALHEKDIEIRKKLGPLYESEYEAMQKQIAAWKELKEWAGGIAATIWKNAAEDLGQIYLKVKTIVDLVKGATGGKEVTLEGPESAVELANKTTKAAEGIKKPSEIKIDPEAIIKEGIIMAKLLYQGWLEEWTHDSEMITAEINAWWADVATTLKETAPVFEKQGPWTEMDLTEAEFNYYKKTAEVAAQARQEWVATYAETPNHIADVLRMQSTWQEFGNNINSVWSENVTGIIKGTQTIGEAFKNMATGMADVFISAITKMIANYILFQNVQGTYKSGMGVVGLIGGLFGAQEGGIFNQPTMRMIGEAGPEAVIPLKNGKVPIEGGAGGGSYTYNHVVINAIDVKSFEDQVKRNPNAVISVLQQNVRRGGQMKDIIRGT